MFENEATSNLWDFGGVRPQQHALTLYGVKLFLGILALLKMQLLGQTVVPDPAPYINSVRRRKNKLPVSSESRVLTLNVPKVLAATRGAPWPAASLHESPCLHWRRGHWRTLHRQSEFEKRTWINKMLVGDPSKGFVRHSYKLVHRMPMMQEQPI
jgi:hypothetical protein